LDNTEIIVEVPEQLGHAATQILNQRITEAGQYCLEGGLFEADVVLSDGWF
jgi:hypothetical protein